MKTNTPFFRIHRVGSGAGLLLAILAMQFLFVSEALAQRGRGGGGAARGGGGSRPSASQRSPSMSRPGQPARSPSSGNLSGANRGGNSAGNRGTTGNRGTAGNRPATGDRAAAGNRGTAGDRAAAGNRSEALNRAGQGAQASRNELNNFLNLEGSAGKQAGNRAAGTNSAISDFLNHDASPQSRNAGQQRGDNINNRTDTRSDLRNSRGDNRDFASDNRQDRLSDRGNRQAVRVSDRGETRSSLAEGRGDRRTDRQQRRGEQADQIRNHLEDHYGQDHLFDDFWSNHPHAHYHFHQNPVFWTWATVGTVRAFMPWNWGSGSGDVYYSDGSVYYGDQSVPASDYAAQAAGIVESAPEIENTDDMEWLPLGVFALTSDDNPDAIPNMFLQLAVSKEGIIAGTYQNKETGETESVEGMVDPESTRAAWTIAGKSSPIMETTIDGLTRNETGVLVHFAGGETQQWMMLHLENPDTASE